MWEKFFHDMTVDLGLGYHYVFYSVFTTEKNVSEKTSFVSSGSYENQTNINSYFSR